ncbi:MAG: M28 family peptidase, partial [Acidobacteriota bacterium]
EKRFPWPFLVRETHIGWTSLRWVDGAGRPSGLLETLQILSYLSRSGAEALFAGEKHSLEEIFTAAEKGAPPAFALTKRATIRRKSRHIPVESNNVIAVLQGTDAELRDEYVVYTAHIDHLGVGPAVDGDAIYNGAFDNASGTAVLLEVARAFAARPNPPRRSVMFLLVTAEEAGLVGSDYFAHHPTVPLNRIVANINLDGGVSLYPAGDIIAWGEEHSSLKPIIRKAAAEEGLEVSPDPFPEETIFVRSDQYSFVRKGIPSVFLMLGIKSLDPQIDGGETLRNWLVTDYHSPKDDMNQSFHFDSGARLARVAYLVGHNVAMAQQRPEWNADDFFGGKFGQSSR